MGEVISLVKDIELEAIPVLTCLTMLYLSYISARWLGTEAIKPLIAKLGQYLDRSCESMSSISRIQQEILAEIKALKERKN
jgi:hypothetical protein